MWQQCPQCKGTGLSSLAGSYSTIPVCDVCNGYKIIHQLTGLPPENKIKGTISNFPTTYTGDYGDAVRNNTDFRDRNMESQQEYFGK